MKEFFNKLLSSKDPTSSKRFVTLITAGCFFLAQFLIILICFYVIFYTTRGKVDIDLLGMLKDVLEYDFYIILSGLGFITADSTMQLIVQKAQAKAALYQAMAQIAKPPEPPVEPDPEQIIK